MRRKYALNSAPFRMLTKAIDGLSLMWYSDAIFSGGGTMVREAALLGLNAYSIFAGKLGAADAALERQGKLKMIRQIEEIDQLKFDKRIGFPQLKRSNETRDFICEQVVRFARQSEAGKSEKLFTCERQARI
jgi:predicted glycosyltransferase